jgi:hypothetical protein
MLNNLETVLITCVVIWASVHLIRHFLPSSYEQRELNWWDDADKRIKAIEEHLNINKPTQE